VLYFYLRKQIICPEEWIANAAIPVIIPYSVLPVTVTWDKSLFEDPKRIYSVITDWTKGSWFDAGHCTFKEYLKDIDSFVIEDPQNSIYSSVEDWEYTEEGNKILYRMFYIAIGDDDGTAINTVSSHSQMEIYPNPVTDICFIKKTSAEEIRLIQIFSITGDKVMEIKGNPSSIDCSNLPKGTYITVIETGNNLKEHYKLIKK
jgi:hypothetical protein